LFDFLRPTPQPLDGFQPIPLQRRRWNFSLFISTTAPHTVDVAPARDEDVSGSRLLIFDTIEMILQRYAIAPPTQEEIDVAMQHAGGNVVDSPASQCQLAEGAQGQTSAADTGEPEYVIGCCGLVAHRARPSPTSH